MNCLPISIISKIDNDVQIWTFNITTEDLETIIEKYGSFGCSVRGTVNDIANEIADIWK